MNTLSKPLALIFVTAVAYAAPRADACSISNAANWNDQQTAIASQVETASVNMDKNSSILGFAQGIVGMWKFSFVAQGNPAPLPPDGTVLDAGFQTWHSDNTEIMNSSRPAATGNFCSGVWKPEGQTYVLNHFALAWNAPGTTPADFAGVANIREQVKLSRDGSSFSGNITLDQYNPDGVTLAVHLTGVITAKRITVYSTVSGD